MNIEKMLAVSFTALLLTACGGGGDDGGADDTPPKTTITPSVGVFLDSAVAGLTYKTTTYTGTTNNKGEYNYLPGETVIFSVGNIVIGSTLASPVVTPLSLVSNATGASDQQVANIVRLLLTLDDDANPNNGINITTAVSSAANQNIDFASTQFATDPGVTSLLAALPDSPALVDEQTAVTHFSTTLANQSNWGTMTWGNGTWKSAAQ